MRKIFRMAIVCVVAGAALLAGCTKDYGTAIEKLNGDYGKLDERVKTLEGTVSDLQGLINKGFVITDVISNAEGFLVKFSNNTEKQVYHGEPGPIGATPKVEIKDGVWFVEGVSTGVKAAGEDGTTPTVEIKDGEWVINGKATGVKAEGKDGHSPVITIKAGEDGALYWAIDDVLTTYKAQGPKGEDGKDANPWEYDSATCEFVQKDAKTGEELQRKSAFPNGDRPLTAVWDSVNNKLIFSNVKSGDKFIDYTIDLNPVLSSIVAVPELYYGGIEAFKYHYMNYIYYKIDGVREDGFVDDDNSDAVIAKLNRTAIVQKAGENDTLYLGSIATVQYWINPAAYDAEANASFVIEGRDYNYMDVPSKAHVGDIKWNPEIYTKNYANGVKKEKDNLYKVQFTIADAGELQPKANAVPGVAANGKSDVSVVRLSGYDKADAKEVSSDYAALVPMEQGLAALAFNVAPKTDDYDKDGIDETYFNSDVKCTKLTGVVGDRYHLYSTAQLAIRNNGIPVTWNAGKRAIDFVTIHLYDADNTKPRKVDETKAVEISIKDFVEKYPGFKIDYELIPYTLGRDGLAPDNDNITPEDWFGLIEKGNADGTGWKFQPCYGERRTNDKSVPIEEVDPKLGISSVGRRPLVIARLYDPKGNVALTGYFKFQIVEKPVDIVIPPTTVDGTVVRDFTNDSNKLIAYTCDRDSLWTDWLDMSSTILEDYFGIDYRTFRKNYQISYKDGATSGTAVPGYLGYVLDTYELKSGNGTKLSDYATTKDAAGSDFKFGTITYVPDPSGDATGGGVNDVFYIYFTKDQKEAILKAGGTKDLYFLVNKKGTNEYFMLGFKVKMAPQSEVEFILHNNTYWFNDVDKSAKTTVRRNVQVPVHYMGTDPENSDVTKYEKSLLDDWDGHVIKIKNSTTIPDIEWSFDTTQPCKVKIGSKTYTFKVHNYGTKANDATTDDQFLSCETQTDTVVVLNRKTGWLTYYYSKDPDHIAKKLLNAYAPKEDDPAKMLYAKIVITAKSYKKDVTGAIVMNAAGEPECEIDLGTESFYARFLRPLTLNISDKASLRDGVATADFFPVGTFIANARDWNAADYGSVDGLGYPIFQQKADGTFETCYYKNQVTGANEVDWYAYYGFKNLWIDLGKIETDQLVPEGNQGLLSAINPRAKVFIAKAAKPTTAIYDATDGNVQLDITNIANLGDWVFSYENHQGTAHDFHLYVPISVEYAWGKFDATIAVPVKGTQISQGN